MSARNCELCGSALSRIRGPSGGRPPLYCHPDTGRRCRLLAKRLRECAVLMEEVFARVETHVKGRTRWRFRHKFLAMAEQWLASERSD